MTSKITSLPKEFLYYLGGAVALFSSPAFAINANNSIVANSITALAPQTCAGHTKISSCIKMQGSVNVTAGNGTPSLYSIDELAFIKDSNAVNGISPSSFTGNGTPSPFVAGAINSSTLGCYVLDLNPGAAGVLNFSCEMASLSCNKVYRYHFAGSHTTTGQVEHSNSNTTATSIFAYTTPCAPGTGVNGTIAQNSADVSLSITKGALPQTISLEYGPTTTYGTLGTITSTSTVAAGSSGSTSITGTLSGLACGGITYHYRFKSTTDDGALNGSVTVDGADQTFTTPACTGVCGTAAGVTRAFAPSSNLCSVGTASSVTTNGSSWGWTCTNVAATTCSAPLSNTSTGSGNAGAVLSGGTWTMAPTGTGANESAGFIPLTGSVKSPPSAPPGYSFPHGLLDFVLLTGVPGSSATLTITYPAALPSGTVYMKYGPTPTSGGTSVWYKMPGVVISGNTVTLTITDGAIGDDDLSANGVIKDAGGPAVPSSTDGIPTLSQWGVVIMAGLLSLFAVIHLRRSGEN